MCSQARTCLGDSVNVNVCALEKSVKDADNELCECGVTTPDVMAPGGHIGNCNTTNRGLVMCNPGTLELENLDMGVSNLSDREIAPVLDMDNARELVTTVTTPNGTVIEVFDDCIAGLCNCVHYIDNVRSQLRPCRFASLLCDELNVWATTHKPLLFSVADGFPIVQGEVPSYDCINYKSILEPEVKCQMDAIVRNELEEGVISEVEFLPHCIHSLGAVPKPGGKIRPITDCSRPDG